MAAAASGYRVPNITEDEISAGEVTHLLKNILKTQFTLALRVDATREVNGWEILRQFIYRRALAIALCDHP